MTVEFRLLGAVEAYADGKPLAIGYAQLRCVLAILLVEANRPVPADYLIDRVWGTRRLPRRPRAALQHSLTLLRQALVGLEGVAIGRHPAGYQLTVDSQAVDLHQFDRLLDQARAATDNDRTAALFKQALALWHGEPFAGLDIPWLNALRTTLGAQHQAAQLDLVDVELRRGRHSALLPRLIVLTERHPLDERLAGQYLLALYRSGRQAEAMTHYELIRRRLADQLGAYPCPPLQRLYQQILSVDPELDDPVSTCAAAGPSPRAVPRQLPAPPRLFVGRAAELAQLDKALDAQVSADGAMIVSAISGVGGIGKTWLALRWAHQRLDRFPDGQLHVNLRGFDSAGHPMSPQAAVRGFLGALGIARAAIPAELDARVGLYRSLVAHRRMLIMLDNARDTAQVAPLLPGSSACTVLVTSRNRLPGLVASYGAQPVTLDALAEPETRALLAARVRAERLNAEPDAVAELLAYCGGLPLALSVVAGRANVHPAFPLAELASELRDATTRLGALDEGDPSVSLPEVLSWSYHALTAQQSSVFLLLGLAPGADIALPAVASLTALPVERVRGVLRELENVSLVLEHVPGRYRMHDLVRLYAAERAVTDLPGDASKAALRRRREFSAARPRATRTDQDSRSAAR